MMQVEKSVFISYRRSTSTYQARAVYQSLSAMGYDVFLDFETIDSGAFDQVILNQIKARAHFVLILAPGSLERCVDQNDWLRQEIETAMAHERNIVPLLFSGFSFSQNAQYMSGTLENLSRYNAIPIYAEFFDEALQRLHTRFLSKPLEMVIHPTPSEEVMIVAARQQAVTQTPEVTIAELTANDHLAEGQQKTNEEDYKGAIQSFNEALRLSPGYAYAYNNRGVVYQKMGDDAAARADYTRAILTGETEVILAFAYTNRGRVKLRQGYIKDAIDDFDAALEHHKKHSKAYAGRATAHQRMGNIDEALRDYTQAIMYEPPDSLIYHTSRALLYAEKNQSELAIADCVAVIERHSDSAQAYNNLGWVHYLLKNYDRAIECANHSLELDSESSGAGATYHTRGAAYLELGMCTEAIADFERALALIPYSEAAIIDLHRAKTECNPANP